MQFVSPFFILQSQSSLMPKSTFILDFNLLCRLSLFIFDEPTHRIEPSADRQTNVNNKTYSLDAINRMFVSQYQYF